MQLASKRTQRLKPRLDADCRDRLPAKGISLSLLYIVSPYSAGAATLKCRSQGF